MTAHGRWPRFAETTTIVEDQAVRRAWQQERRPFFVAVVLLARSQHVQRRLADVFAGLSPWCHPAAPGQAHVTLVAIGADDRAAQRARRVLGQQCEVTVGGADSFTAAPFLRVDGDALHAMREAVLAAAGTETDAPSPWVPHVTVGTYRRAVTRDDLAARLAPFRDLPELHVRGRTTVMVVDRSSDVGGLLPLPLARSGLPPASGA